MNCNKIILIGRVTRQPELKATAGGSNVVNLCLATNHNWKDKEGIKQESTTFHNIVAFGKQAEILAQYVQKGQELYVEGRQENRTYDKADGTKGYSSEVLVDNFQFGQKAKGTEQPAVSTVPDYPEEDIAPEDIPF